VLDELRPGLWRWTARHPDAEEDPQPGSPADWPPDVGCVAFAAPGALVVVDPLVPGDAEEEFLARMDELVARHGPRVVVLTTIGFHRRSRAVFVERYGASTSRAKAALPDGVRTVPIRRAGETMVWLEEHRALVPGDRLLGDDTGGLRLPPPSWLRYLPSGMTIDELRAALAPLRELPVEMVLVSHGAPVLRDGARAIERALDGAA
jgi:glyoxylase-like metal-dependent hydrolase (beta-lactamase superfamily II)